jgi:predicted RNA binding protein YcfA (HicA-like mRNA interferase family)
MNCGKGSHVYNSLRKLGFSLTYYQGCGHPVYEHPEVDGKVVTSGSPKNRDIARKRALRDANRLLEAANVRT